MEGPITRVKLYEDVANQLADQVQRGEWEAGTQIPPEAELARRFDVSRSTIREAIRTLQIAGILRSRPGSGTFVAESAPMRLHTRELAAVMEDPAHLLDLIESRRLLEPQMAALAARRGSPEEKTALLEQASAMAKEVEREKLMSQGHSFHKALAQMCGNAVLMGFYRSVESQLRSMRGLQSLTLEVYLDGARDHLAIAQAVAAGEGEIAAQAMADHLRKDYAAYMREG